MSLDEVGSFFSKSVSNVYFCYWVTLQITPMKLRPLVNDSKKKMFKIKIIIFGGLM
jgi:hypothetical protein